MWSASNWRNAMSMRGRAKARRLRATRRTKLPTSPPIPALSKTAPMARTCSSAEKTGERTGKVTGNLTLLGQTHPLTLDVTWNKSDAYPFGHGKHTIGISARGTVKRSLYGMTYAVANVFLTLWGPIIIGLVSRNPPG